jgi:hypothetical protein
MSIIVLIQVRSIKRSFLMRARLPEILSALRRMNADLLKGLGNSGSPTWDPRKDLARLNAVLASLEGKADRPQRELVEIVRHKSAQGNLTFASYRIVESGDKG